MIIYHKTVDTLVMSEIVVEQYGGHIKSSKVELDNYSMQFQETLGELTNGGKLLVAGDYDHKIAGIPYFKERDCKYGKMVESSKFIRELKDRKNANFS